MAEKDYQTLKQESNDRVERLHLHDTQEMQGLIPESSPPTFVVTYKMLKAGRPWFWGPDFQPTEQQLQAVEDQAAEDEARREASS